MNPTIQTELHRISVSRYMSTVMEDWLGRYWWILAIPVAGCLAVGAFVNMAFTFVAFMFLCLVVPFIMMLIYYNYALTPEATIAVRPHWVSLNPDSGIDVEFRPDPETGREYKPVHIDWAQISSVESRSSDVVIKFHHGGFRYLIIPFFALNNDDPAMVGELHELLRRVGKYNPIIL